MLIFIAGSMLGCFLGVAVMCMCRVAGDADRKSTGEYFE